MRTVLPFKVQPIEDDGFHILVTAQINSVGVNLIIDTGASRSVFDEKSITPFISELPIEDQDRLSSGIGTNTLKSKKVEIDELVLGEIVIKNYEAALIDLTHVNISYEKLGLESIDGIMGGDILYKFKAQIAYDREELILTKK